MASNDLVYSIVTRANPAVKGLNKIADALDNIANTGAKAKSVMDGLLPSGTTTQIKRASESLKHTGDNAKKASGKIGMLLASLKRVAFYRAIRTALKEIAQAFVEGTNNLYYYSQALGNVDSAHAVGTMNEFATTALYVKNSLGAALMPILQALVPVVNAIADAFVWATNAVNQFFHALKGESVFTKAKRYAVDYAEALGGASGAAKELKKQIFGFDELNIFNSPSGGSGGGASGLDYSGMFEEAEIAGVFKKIKDTFDRFLGEDFWARFKVNVKEIAFDWSGLNKEQIAKKILTGFFALLGGIAGFTIGGKMGAIVGSLLGATIGTYISTLTFNGDGVVSGAELKSMLVDVLLTMTGGLVGWMIGGPGGALVGLSVGASITALLNTFNVKGNTTLDFQTLGEGLRIAAMAITGGLVGWAVGGLGGAMLGLTVGTGLTALINALAPAAGTHLEEAAFAGLLLATLKAIINPKSMVLGLGGTAGTFALIAGAAVTMSIASILTDAGYKSTAEKFAALLAEGIGTVIGGVAGASLLTFAALPGGLIGITIGATLSLLITKVFKNYTPESKRQLEQMGQAVDLQAKDAYIYSQGYSTQEIKAKGRASGGIVPAGTYFYAGEPGNPELIGTYGGQTNVTNQDQFTAGMWDVMDNTNSVILQAAQTLVQAIQSKPVPSFQIGDRDIVSAYDRGKTLAGSALVE